MNRHRVRQSNRSIHLRRILATLCLLAAAPDAGAQNVPFDRLSTDVFDVTPPAARVRGGPGAMAARPRECRTRPLPEIRRWIVDVAVQEWGFFGFPVRDEKAFAADRPGFFRRLSPEESLRVASSVAGYWSVTPEATMMIARQNASWSGSDVPRRADPWSAAFVSWVMCEAGLGASVRFQRAIAHHVYIDQAIRARQDATPQSAFVAYDAGEAAVAPGDLLCAARRPVYRTLAERRRQLGVGARTHCDVVVKVDESAGRIFAIGGNVGRAVSLKRLEAVRGPSGHLRATTLDEGRPVFAHLKLRAEPIEAHALDNSPTIKALACAGGFEAPLQVSRLLSAPVSRSSTRQC